MRFIPLLLNEELRWKVKFMGKRARCMHILIPKAHNRTILIAI